MAQRDLLKRYLDAGMAFTAMTKSKAEAIAKELVKAGEIQRDQVQSQVDELIERSRRNSDHLVALVRKEVTAQLTDLGTTLRDELRSLERRLGGAPPTTTESTATKAPAKKAPAKRAPAKKAPAKKAVPAPAAEAPEAATPEVVTAPTKKAPAKRSPAKKAPAKRAPAKRTAAKKAPPETAPGSGPDAS